MVKGKTALRVRLAYQTATDSGRRSGDWRRPVGCKIVAVERVFSLACRSRRRASAYVTNLNFASSGIKSPYEWLVICANASGNLVSTNKLRSHDCQAD
jgi:hypothetical protein